MNFLIKNDIIILIPEIFLLSSILVITIIYAIYSNIAIYKYTKLLEAMVTVSVTILVIYITLALNSVSYKSIISSYYLINNHYNLIIKIVLAIFLIILFLCSYHYLRSHNISSYEIYLLILLSFFGMVLLVMSYDLIMMYLAIELQTFSFYILTAMHRYKVNKSIEAALKYFILGSFSSSILILGIAIIYGLTGMTGFKDLSDLLLLGLDSVTLDYYLYLGIILIYIGFFFKISIAPFHIWLPDIFDGSIKVVIAIFATLPKISLFYILYQLNLVLFIKVLTDWQSYIIVFVILSWVIGILGALKVNKLNKLLAYSSINHMGFMLLSVAVNNMDTFIIYIIIYNTITINIFVILFSLVKYNNNMEINKIDQLKYIYKSNGVLSSCFILVLFSLAGIPPLAGFFSKYILFMEVMKLHWYITVLIGLLLSIISSFYYLRLIKLIIFNNNNSWIFLRPIPKVNSYIISFLTLFNIFFIFLIPFITEFLKYISYL